ncbi:MAG: hypothetical protein ACR652_02005 [Methylocystis sp.]|uniref:hypothetical protein n=1 Tax=Methylocystis sp. TaxID=1911079 RepID=UPI003DA35EDC
MAQAKTSEAGPPTVEQIRSDIDHAAAEDKIAFPDPAAAPLGADAEAGGAPATARQRAMAAPPGPARKQEQPPPQGGVVIAWRSLALGALAFALAGGLLVSMRFG